MPERYYPVQLKTRLADATSTTADWRFLHADTILSGLNRRLYRQSRVYSMKIDLDPNSVAAANGMEVWVLRNTWDTHGAYKFAMAHYYNAMKEELEVAGAQTRWHDFRVRTSLATDTLIAQAANLNATGAIGFTDQNVGFALGDFSQITDANGVAKEFVLDDNATATQYSIFLEWEKKDRVQQDPSSQEQSLAYEGITEDRDEANYDHIRTNGNNPPYSQDADDAMWQKIAFIGNNGAVDAKLSTGFFEAPLGIVILKSVGTFTTSTVSEHPFTVTFQKGDYKGVKAPAYATPILTPENRYEVV